MAPRRRAVVGVALLAASAAATACRGRDAPVAPGAPVVLISIDTLRADHLPAYGYAGVKTPNLDRIRRDAILFESAWSPCPMTLPSHVTMLTGLLPPEHGVRNNAGFVFDAASHSHLPGRLKARGYATGAAVSSYVLRGETGLAALFDEYEDSVDARGGAEFADRQRPGMLTAVVAKRWIDAHAGSPFFYFFHVYEPHVPWEAPPPFRGRHTLAYDDEVEAADAVVGDLLDHLRETGVYDRALVIVTSDHGEGLGDHGEEQHSILLYREAIQVPLFLKLPGARRAGEVVKTPVQLADIAPTVAEVVGLEGTSGPSGRSLLAGPQAQARPLYAETLYPRLQLGWSELRSVVDGRWHYIQGPRPELYDLARDPRERQDLAAREPEEVETLRAALGGMPKGPAVPRGVDPATAERLAALGYVGTVRDRPEGSPLPNPRDMLPQLEPMKEGFRLASAGRSDDAAVVLAEVVRAQPANVEAWVRLGGVLLELNRAADAVGAYQAALARGGVDLPDVRVQLGHALLRAGRLEEAEAAAKRVQAELSAKSNELLARVALARGHLDEARRLADQASEGRNPQPDSWLVGAEVRIRSGDYDGALRRLDEAEHRAKALGADAVRNLEALRADALARSGRTRQAEEAFRREVAAFPSNVLAHANLAALLFAAGRREEARAALAAMVAANPGPRGCRAAAVTLDAVGDVRGAARWRACGAAGKEKG